MMNRVLVTGASGFIGSHVAEAVIEQGWTCVVLVRNPGRLCPEIKDHCEVRLGDICDLHSLTAATRDCSAIIHLAGKAGDWGTYKEFYDNNVQGTLNVLEASCRNRIDYTIITGSISSYGEEHCTELKDESSPFNSHYPYFLDRLFPCRMNWYRDTKAEATKQAMALAHERGLNLTIIEPVWVYGEREFNTGFYEYAKSVRDGLRFVPGSRTNTFHVIYARDLAQAYIRAVQNKVSGVERIIVGNPQPESMQRIFSLFCTEAGLQPPRKLPKWASYPLACALELISTLLQSPRPPLLTRGRVNMFYDSIGYSIQKAERTLGFLCEYSLEQGVRATVKWYRDNNLL